MLDLRKQRNLPAQNLYNEVNSLAGFWVIYRRYDLSTPAARDKMTGEGTNKRDRYQHVDEPIVARQESTGITGTRGIITDKSIFYLPATARPKRGDVIITVQLPDRATYSIIPNEVIQATQSERYRIVEIDTKRVQYGQVSYYACVVEPEFGNF